MQFIADMQMASNSYTLIYQKVYYNQLYYLTQ